MKIAQEQHCYMGLPQGTDCVDCGNCLGVCRAGVLEEITDGSGFCHVFAKHPARCVSCGRCLAVCPMLGSGSENSRVNAFAAWHRDAAIVQASTSGGVFSALAQAVFERGGIVAGVKMEGRNANYALVENESGMSALRGSKYLPSTIGPVYEGVAAGLRGGRIVLCVGLPCQIAGLKKRLAAERVEGSLIAVDLVCSGMPSPRVFEMECKKSGMEVESFRDKRGCSWKTSHALRGRGRDGVEVRVRLKKSPFYSGFSDSLILRNSCYDCPFARLPRVGDITLGDFWGIKRFPDRQASGISLVLANNGRGMEFLESCRHLLELYPARLDEALKNNPKLYCGKQPYKEHPLRNMLDYACLHFPWWLVKLLYGGTYRRFLLGKLPFELFYPGFCRKDVRHAREKGLQEAFAKFPQQPVLPAIGIVTFHRASNFGAMLQTYALQMTLAKCNPGAKVLVMDYRPRWMERNVPCYKLRKHKQRQQFLDFAAKHLMCTDVASGDLGVCARSLAAEGGDYALVVGSDQVWNPAITKEAWKAFFLGIEDKHCRRISYSASFGESSLLCSPEKLEGIRECLKAFSKISVREKSGIGICQELGRDDAVQTLDPTLAADPGIYDALLAEARTAPAGITGIFLDEMPGHARMLRELKRSTGRQARVVSGRFRPFSCFDRPFSTSVPDYLMSIKCASGVLTDSYHALIFSLIFRRPFVVVPSGRNERRFERIGDLLSMLGLSERVVTDFDAGKCQSMLEKEIDYDSVHAIISGRRALAQEYLRGLVGTCN